MTTVTKELILKTVKQLARQATDLNSTAADIKNQVAALQLHMAAMRQDVRNISRILDRQTGRLDRIACVLESAKVAK